MLPEYRHTAGNRGVVVLRRLEGERVRFVVVSQWDSIESIRAFAGEDVARAQYQPEALEFLIDPEPFAIHYDVVPGSDLPAG